MSRNYCLQTSLLLFCLLLTDVSMLAGPKLHRLFYSYDASNGLADNSAQTIKCTKTGRMVISTIGHINFFDGDAFVHIDPTEENLFPLPKYTGHYRLYFDRFHHLWLKDKGSVTCLDLMTERFVNDVDSVVRSLGMSHEVDDLFADVNCHLWILSGDSLYGINAGRNFPILHQAELQDVDVYDNKLLLQFYANGVVAVFNMETGQHLYDAAALDQSDGEKYKKSSVVCPVGDRYYQIRNGTKESLLLCFDIKSRRWTRVMQLPYHLNNMVVHRGQLFVASEYGYWTYSLTTGQLEHVEELRLTDDRRLRTDINSICFDRQGGMWLGTERRGLLYSRPYKIPFVSYTWDEPEALQYSRMMDAQPQPESLPRHVNCTYTDSRGWKWTGTYTGLLLEKPGEAEVRHFTTHDGLQNEMVRSIIEDDMHNMWIATSFGVSHLYIRDGDVHQVESYNHRDNVPRESFVNGRVMKLDDGTIVMQALDHVMAFHPSNFYDEELKGMRLYPKLVRLMVNGHFISAGTKLDGKLILDKAITRTREITVNYSHNTLLLTFSGLNYMRPSQTYYRMRIKGLYDSWKVFSYANSDGRVDSRGLFHLPLTALSPGTYELELQASMQPDAWPEEPLTWIIRVEEPWWRSTGIYLLLVVTIVVLILVNIIFFIRNTRLRFMRNNEETDVLRRVKSIAERCNIMSGELLTPQLRAYDGDADIQNELSDDFEKAMLVIVPYLNKNNNESVTIHQLAAVSGTPLEKLYQSIAANLYKSPRTLVLKLRLQKAAEMLLKADRQTAVEDVARECRFVSTNYFIASFYHYYRQTPQDYLNNNPL